MPNQEALEKYRLEANR